MMQQYLKELEEEPFDENEFVERLAWRVQDNSTKGFANFDPVLMYDTFTQAIKDLELLQERQRKKCDKLEITGKEDENTHWTDVSAFQEKNKEAAAIFKELDEKINYVATKVIHLGDQLENVNTPRSRAVEAQKLMTFFDDFLSPGPVSTDTFVDKEQVFEAADIIQKLHVTAQELPSLKFEDARKKISTKYDEIERTLIEEFVKYHRMNNKDQMRQIALILSNFKGYSQCIDAFIEQSQTGTYGGKDIFNEIMPMIKNNHELIKEVFINPEQVLAKFVLNIYHLRLQKYIVSNLLDKNDLDKYLKNLMTLYSKTINLSKSLMIYDMGTDENYLNKLSENIFQKYLENYAATESRCLRMKFTNALHNYYLSKGHQKKQIQSGGFKDLRRDLQAVIGARTNINIALIEDYGGETFLSEELAVNMLKDAKAAVERCQLLSKNQEIPNNISQILELVLSYLIIDHVDYAVELGLQAVPIPESKSSNQKIYFFDIVHKTNTIVNLFEKLFIEQIVPSLISTPRYGEILLRKKSIISQLEQKLENGIDRSISAIIGCIKNYLQTEQKKSDFKPENDHDTLSSSACLNVVQYINTMVSHIKESLDARNLDLVLTELGCRFNRVIYEHLLQFQYNSSGSMCAICDVNEYRKCANEFKSQLVNVLFDTLHALCNLLLVKPENLNQVCTGDQLVVLERTVLLNFIQLRSDYKSQKIAAYLKGITT